METSMPESDAEGLPESVQRPASPPAHCNDGLLKGNRNFFPSTAGLKNSVFQHNMIKNYIHLSILKKHPFLKKNIATYVQRRVQGSNRAVLPFVSRSDQL